MSYSFDNWQKKFEEVSNNPPASNTNKFRRIAEVLKSLQEFISKERYSKSGFRNEVDRVFLSLPQDETEVKTQEYLKDFCNTKAEAQQALSRSMEILEPFIKNIDACYAQTDIARKWLDELTDMIK